MIINQLESELDRLPMGWVTTTLGAIRSDVSRGILPSDTPEQVFDLYSIPNFPLREPEVLTGAAVGSNKQTTSPGTVLLSKINPRINRVWLVRPVDEHPQIASTEWISFGPLQSLNAAYLAFYMQRNQFRDYLAANVSGVGGSLTRTNTAVIDRSSFPLPPLAEQRRIVTKIEELFSKLDAGVAELKRTRVLLKRYRQSVLHAAVTGELSRGWREAQGDKLEDAGHLLAHILDERRARWAASGKKGEYREPESPKANSKFPLPKGWAWSTLDQITSSQPRSMQSGPFGSKLKHDEFQNEGFLVLGIDNVKNGTFSMGREHRISKEKFEELKSFEARPLDFLIVVMASLGKSCVLPQNTERSVVTKHVYRVTVEGNIINPYFLNLCVMGHQYVLEQIYGSAQGQTRPGLNKGILQSVTVPVPYIEEQAYIIAEVERRLSILANVEATVQAELKRAESTRQGILRRAFSGQLVPQDPSDQPASVLLERIQAEKLAAGAASIRAGGKRGRKPKAITQDTLLKAVNNS